MESNIISWGIALFEYSLMVPANRIGSLSGMSGFQLKITQEVITLVVFNRIALLYLKEPFHWKYLVSFALIVGAVRSHSGNNCITILNPNSQKNIMKKIVLIAATLFCFVAGRLK